MNLKTSISEEIINTNWDEFVIHTNGGHHVQTFEWAKVKAELGWKSVRLIIEDDQQIVAGAQILIKSIPFLGKIGYITKGPVCKNNDPNIGRFVIDQILRIITLNHFQFMVLQPPNNSDFLIDILTAQQFLPSSLELAPSASVILDLSLELDYILKNTSRSTKTRLNRGKKSNLIIREGNKNDLNIFYPLYLSTAKRQHFSPFKLEYFSNLWDLFSPKGWISLILVCTADNIPVSTGLLIPFGDTVIGKKLGWSGEFSNLHPNDAVLWACIEWSKEHGYRYFDFEGVNRTGARLLLEGEKIQEGSRLSKDSIKYGFGGEIVFFPETYDFMTNRFYNWVYRHTQSILYKNELLAHLVDIIRNK